MNPLNTWSREVRELIKEHGISITTVPMIINPDRVVIHSEEMPAINLYVPLVTRSSKVT